jgi:hypothetical protein
MKVEVKLPDSAAAMKVAFCTPEGIIKAISVVELDGDNRTWVEIPELPEPGDRIVQL